LCCIWHLRFELTDRHPGSQSSPTSGRSIFPDSENPWNLDKPRARIWTFERNRNVYASTVLGIDGTDLPRDLLPEIADADTRLLDRLIEAKHVIIETLIIATMNSDVVAGEHQRRLEAEAAGPVHNPMDDEAF
jgi:hypothetical protein